MQFQRGLVFLLGSTLERWTLTSTSYWTASFQFRCQIGWYKLCKLEDWGGNWFVYGVYNWCRQKKTWIHFGGCIIIGHVVWEQMKANIRWRKEKDFPCWCEAFWPFNTFSYAMKSRSASWVSSLGTLNLIFAVVSSNHFGSDSSFKHQWC